MDSQTFRDVLAQFVTGITVVISGIPGAIRGMTVNSFTSVSLHPPLVLFCADNRADTFSAVMSSHRFTVSILSEQQEAVSQRFALIGPQDTLYSTLNCGMGLGGIPYLKDSLAYLDCAVDDVVQAGDHHIIVGLVEHLELLNPGRPLMYFQSQYYHPGTLPPD